MSNTSLPSTNYRIILYLVVFSIFLFFRIASWHNEPLFEDHDSVVLMKQALTYRSLDMNKISELDASKTPFYPAFVALLTPSDESVEFGARVTTFLFSLVLFFIFIILGEKYTSPIGVASGLLFLSASPELIRLSFSILTEPSYITTVYLGLAIFLWHCHKPSILKSILLGVVFGAAFLNRVEGILFLVFIPVAHLGHYFFNTENKYQFQACLKYCAIFIFTYSLVITPQIMSVSEKMNQFSLNGRQVWSKLLSGDVSNRSYEEKLLGLDYSPKEVNIQYLLKNPLEVSSGNNSFSLIKYAKTVLKNFDELYRYRLGELLGPFCIFFAGIGLYGLLSRKMYFETLFFLGFIITGLVAPLVHNVVIRHIAVIAPAAMLLAGVGIGQLSDLLKSNIHQLNRVWLISIIILATVFITMFPQMLKLKESILDEDTINHEYRPSDYDQVVRILKNDVIRQGLKLSEAKISSRKHYVSFYSGLERVRIPYAEYNELVNYLNLNSVDYLYLDYRKLKSYPFLDDFSGDISSDFTLLFDGVNWKNDNIRLYRIN